MDSLTLLIIAIGLSFDTFAVSISCGLMQKEIKFINACKIALCMAFFQAAMPVIGWFLGSSVKTFMHEIDHWIAFILLALLGIRMIYESLKHEEERKEFNPLNLKVLISISIATSIDALVVGISFALLNLNIIWSAFVIGAVTYTVAMLGILFGKKTGNLFGKRMEILGGLILIGIGTKILIEHLL
jgi:manganese efflux pump family protein